MTFDLVYLDIENGQANKRMILYDLESAFIYLICTFAMQTNKIVSCTTMTLSA